MIIAYRTAAGSCSLGSFFVRRFSRLLQLGRSQHRMFNSVNQPVRAPAGCTQAPAANCASAGTFSCGSDNNAATNFAVCRGNSGLAAWAALQRRIINVGDHLSGFFRNSVPSPVRPTFRGFVNAGTSISGWRPHVGFANFDDEISGYLQRGQSGGLNRRLTGDHLGRWGRSPRLSPGIRAAAREVTHQRHGDVTTRLVRSASVVVRNAPR